MATVATDSVREKSLQDYRKKLLEHREYEAKLKESKSMLKLNFEFDLQSINFRNDL